MKTLNILVPMKLEGQGKAPAGYAMAALLVAMSIMAVMLTVAMPVWKQATQREKEEELIFRGMQYAHAIGLFQRKYANAYPPSLDVLVNEKFLRKKFKDPITKDDFAPVLAGQNTQGGTQVGGATTGRGGAQPPTPSPATQPAGRGGTIGASSPGGPGGGSTGGGIVGVTSKSKDKSIRLYNGRSHYNEWQFVWVQQVQNAGQGAPGATTPGGRGRGQGPGTGPGTGPGVNGPFPRGGPGGGRGGPGRGFGPGQPPPQPPGPGRGRD